jgi:hypothetical protein
MDDGVRRTGAWTEEVSMMATCAGEACAASVHEVMMSPGCPCQCLVGVRGV